MREKQACQQPAHFLKSQLHAYYSSPGMKPTSHVASPLPQHTLAYLSHAVPSASHCCQKRIAGLLITCQWAWREGRSINAHPGAERFMKELEKPASTARAPVGRGGRDTDGHVKLWSPKDIEVTGGFGGGLRSSPSPCGPHPVGHLL